MRRRCIHCLGQKEDKIINITLGDKIIIIFVVLLVLYIFTSPNKYIIEIKT